MATDKVLIDATETELLLNLEQAVRSANEGARARLCYPNTRDWASAVVASPRGCREGSGGCVPHAYRGHATTSVVGVAWFTDAAGRKHARIIGARVGAAHTPYGQGGVEAFPDGPFPALVYGLLRQPVIYKTKRRAIDRQVLAVMDALAEAPDDAASWAVLADLLEEQRPGEEVVRWLVRQRLADVALELRPASVRKALALATALRDPQASAATVAALAVLPGAAN